MSEKFIKIKTFKIDFRDIVLFTIIIVLVFVRYYFSLPDIPDGKEVKISGKVSTEPTYYEKTQGIRINGFFVYLPLYPQINYGDEIILSGVVEGRKIKNAKVIELNPSKSVLLKTRKKILIFFEKTLPTDSSALVSGMVLGSKANLTTEFWEKLKRSGTAHVVVASGMNVTLVATFLINTLVLFFKRKQAIAFALFGIWIYTLLAGFDAPIVRAAIMGSVAFVAQALGKLNTAWRGLFLSAGLMLVVRPLWLTDLGFVLSFVATSSLILFESPVRRKLRFLPNVFREGLSTSLAAQIGVMPILVFAFKQFNPLSPIINAIVLWTVAPITIIGGISGITSLIFDPFAKIMLYLNYPLTYWFISVVEIFS